MRKKGSSKTCKCLCSFALCSNCETRKSSKEERSKSPHIPCKIHQNRASPYCHDCKTGNMVPDSTASLLSRNSSFVSSGASSSGAECQGALHGPNKNRGIKKMTRVDSGFDLKDISSIQNDEEYVCDYC